MPSAESLPRWVLIVFVFPRRNGLQKEKGKYSDFWREYLQKKGKKGF